ncbi:WD40-repeat-containing domain protein [Trichoderma camerunense]
MTEMVYKSLAIRRDGVVLAFSPNKKLLAVNSAKRLIKIWNIATNMPEHKFVINDGGTHVAISPDNRLMACGVVDSKIRIWDLTTGTLIRKLQHKHDDIHSLLFSPNGHLLASFTCCGFRPGDRYEQQRINIWDHAKGYELHDLVHLAKKSPLQFYVDEFHQSNELDNINLWNPTTGGLLKELETAGSLDHSRFCISNDLVSMEHQSKIVQHGTVITLEYDDFDNEWVCFEGQRVLLLPPRYQPSCWALNNNILALGHSSGGVTFIKFSPPAKPCDSAI